MSEYEQLRYEQYMREQAERRLNEILEEHWPEVAAKWKIVLEPIGNLMFITTTEENLEITYEDTIPHMDLPGHR